jgi:hypothetical protein
VIAIVITLVVLLALAVIVAVARDPGYDPADVAIGYARALAVHDFDALYRMIDPELLEGRNRPQWVAEQATRPHLAISPDAVEVREHVVADGAATVTLSIGTDHLVPVELVVRQRVWTVVRFDGASAATARR